MTSLKSNCVDDGLHQQDTLICTAFVGYEDRRYPTQHHRACADTIIVNNSDSNESHLLSTYFVATSLFL